MTKAGKANWLKIYPPFGNSHKNGHRFAFLGSKVWFDDVFAFVEHHCAPAS